MGKNTKALSGPAKTKYLAGALATEPVLDDAASQRLLLILDNEIAQMRVRVPVPKRKPHVATVVAVACTDAAVVTAAEPAIEQASFDPHAFSLVVVMSRQGADGLSKQLDSIVDPIELRSIAKAQHISIPDDANQSVGELRAALIAGTAQRIADRRAAAS